MSFQLAEPPGFTDVPEALMTADTSVASGFLMSAIKDNCAGGTVMPEFFQGFYTHGQTVPLPTSPADNYQYARSECIYVWEIMNTTNQASGNPSQSGGVFWLRPYVDQATGLVNSEVYYYVQGGAGAPSNDGVLTVTTIGVRGKQLRKMVATIAGTLTSGGFLLGERIIQSSTGATAYVDPGSALPGGGNVLTVLAAVMGAPDSTHTWTGQSSGAVYTPTGLPTNYTPKYSVAGTLSSGTFQNGEVATQATSGAQGIVTLLLPGTTLVLLGPLSGTADATHAWTGASSGAVFTPSAAPVFVSTRYTDLPASAFNVDAALSQTLLRDLAKNSKLATVRTECILMNPSGAGVWRPGHIYNAGDLVQPSGRWANGCWYVAANAGQSGLIEPGPWPSVPNNTTQVFDGGVIWNIAGAGFTFGQQVPLPVSPFDGYEYSAAEIYAVMPFFHTTQAYPVQKGVGITWTSGKGDIRALAKNIAATAPTWPSNLPNGTQPPDTSGGTVYTGWNFVNQAVAAIYGTVTSGTFSNGETVKQSVTNATGIVTLPLPAPWPLYITSGAGTPDATHNWVGQSSGAVFTPTSALLPVPAPEVHEPALAAAGTATTGCGYVFNAVTYSDAPYSDGSVHVLVIASRQLGAAMAAPGGAVFVDFSTDSVLSGQTLPNTVAQYINENAKFAILRPEVQMEFSVTPGTAVSVPASPWDSYAYAPSECLYLYWWTSTGTGAGAMRDFSVQVNPQSGVVCTRTDYFRSGSQVSWLGIFAFGPSTSIGTAMYGYPGSPVYSNMGGAGRGTPTVNVAVIERRSHLTELQPQQILNGTSAPAPAGSTDLLPNDGFEIQRLPGGNAVAIQGVALDWSVIQNTGQTTVAEEAGLVPGSNFAQGASALSTATTLSGRSTNAVNRISYGSTIIAIDPNGTYQLNFPAEASPNVINYGFYCRIHLLDLNGANDTAFDLLWPTRGASDNLTPPGIGLSNNPGSPLSSGVVTNFGPFIFAMPPNGAVSVQTGFGLSLLCQGGTAVTLGFIPSFMYVEFDLWSPIYSGGLEVLFSIVDNVILKNITGLNTQPVNSAQQLVSPAVLLQSGTSTQINVSASQLSFPNKLVNYSSGSVDPGAYGTFWIYCVDPNYNGGAVTYLTTQNQSDLSAQNGVVVFGSITTVVGGGGSGGGGSGGGSSVTISTRSLPRGLHGTTYSGATMAAYGGITPYTWSIISGSLPSALSMTGGGVISGNLGAATAGDYPLTIKVTDSSSPAQTATATFDLFVG